LDALRYEQTPTGEAEATSRHGNHVERELPIWHLPGDGVHDPFQHPAEPSATEAV
jgi:hypothetical protein